jgi:hypothetical protein
MRPTMRVLDVTDPDAIARVLRRHGLARELEYVPFALMDGSYRDGPDEPLPVALGS